MRKRTGLAIALGCAGAIAAANAWAKPIERLTAFAVDMSEIAGRTKAGTVDILIERWTTDAERERLRSALKEGGSDALLRALRDIKDEVGTIRSPGSLGYPLRFALQVPHGAGGRRLIIATDRPVSFFEAWTRPRTSDYPFMIIDIRLDAKGEGEGKLLPLAKITAHGQHVVEVENYASVPVRLTKVRSETGSGQGGSR
jgi:hypothetical protein